MNTSRSTLALLFVTLAAFAPLGAGAADTSRVYELRTYTATPGNLPAVLARFRNHTTKLFEKYGMVNVAYWVPAEEKDGAAEKLIYLLEHKSREAAKVSWKAFSADPEWQAVKQKTEANGKIVAKAESVFLEPTAFSKPMTTGNSKGAPRFFEMRTYTAAEGKMAALDARLRDLAMPLFAKHGMTSLGYFHPLDADKGAGQTLIYFLAFPSRDAAAAAWKAFRDDPAWAKARAESEKAGKVTSKVESVYLNPTDFSRVK